MTLTIDLAPDIESQLEQEARRLGLGTAEYVRRLIEDGLPQKPKTGAELVSYWQREGLIGTRPDIIDSAAYARNLRRRVETRKRG